MSDLLCLKCGKRERYERNGRVFNLCSVCAWNNLQTLFYGENDEYKCITCNGTGYIDAYRCESCDGVGFYADDLEEDKELIGGIVLSDAADKCPRCDGGWIRKGTLGQTQCSYCEGTGVRHESN